MAALLPSRRARWRPSAGPPPLTISAGRSPHEHIVVLRPEALQNYGHFSGGATGTKRSVSATRSRSSRGPGRGDRTLVDPTAPGSAAASPASSGSTGGRPQHRRCHRRLRGPGAAELPPLPQRRVDRRAVRPRAAGGDRRHGGQGGVPQVRRRGARPRRRHPEDPRRVAIAARETGAPVMVHTNASVGTGTLALEALTSRGVDPVRIVVAHAGDSNDLPYLRTIADTGAILGFDRFNIPHFNPDADRIRTLLALLEEGYGDRIHLSHDGACFYDSWSATPTSPTSAPTTSTSRPGSSRAPRARGHRNADRRADDRQPAALPRPTSA